MSPKFPSKIQGQFNTKNHINIRITRLFSDYKKKENIIINKDDNIHKSEALKRQDKRTITLGENIRTK